MLCDPQISCQNPVTKSQVLLALKSTTTAVIHAYQLGLKPSEMKKDVYFDFMQMTKLMEADIVKYELVLTIRDMICYVAPTIIEGEYQTLWANACNKSFSDADCDMDLR